MERSVEVDGVEGPDVIVVLLEQVAGLRQQGAFGICDEIAGVELEDVGLDVVPRLAAAGTADHQHIEVAVQL